MRLRLDELDAWRERAALTVRPEQRYYPVLPRDEDEQYERWLWSRATLTLDALELYGRPMDFDAAEVIECALAYRDMSPKQSDGCYVQKLSGAWCDGSCARWQR